MKPRRGEVWWIVFDPRVGSEVQKTRPAVVVSNDSSNRHLDRFQVVPLTSNVNRVYTGEVLVQIKKETGKVMGNQITTASQHRFHKKLAVLNTTDLKKVEAALKIQLGLD